MAFSGSGAASGAASGAQAGAMFGAPGAVVGGVAGGLLGGFGGGGGGAEDLATMFESQDVARKLIKNTYDKRARGKISDYLSNPIPVTGAEAYEAQYFGAGPDQRLLDIFNIRKDKKRKKALKKYYKNYDYEAEAARAANSPFNQRLSGTVDRIEENLLPSVDELLSTGFRTDIDPIVAEEMRRLREETAPALGARYRTSLRSSGFDNATGQAIEDLGVRLGTLAFNADEAAAARRSNAITSGAAGNAYQLPLNLELGGALVTGSAGERARGRFEGTRPGGRLLSGLGTLAGIEQGGGFVQEGSGGGGITDLGAVLGQSGVLDSLFSRGSSGSGSGGSMTQLPATGGPQGNPFAYSGIA